MSGYVGIGPRLPSLIPLPAAGCEIQGEVGWLSLLGSYEKEPVDILAQGEGWTQSPSHWNPSHSSSHRPISGRWRDTLASLAQGTPWMTILSSRTLWWSWGTFFRHYRALGCFPRPILHLRADLAHGLAPLPTPHLSSYVLSCRHLP